MYKRCIHSIFGGEITRHAVINGFYVRFWPTLREECGSSGVARRCSNIVGVRPALYTLYDTTTSLTLCIGVATTSHTL